MSDIAIHPPATHRRALPGPGVVARDFAYLVTGLPVGVVAFTVAVTGLALAAGLAITLIGIPVLIATLLSCRALSLMERHRAALVLGPPGPAVHRPTEGGLWQRTKTIATDPASWRDVLWSLLVLPVGTLGFCVAISLWSTALGLITSPAYYWAMPDDDATVALLDDQSAGYTALRVLIGLALLPLAVAACRALAEGSARLARVTLGDSR